MLIKLQTLWLLLIVVFIGVRAALIFAVGVRAEVLSGMAPLAAVLRREC